MHKDTPFSFLIFNIYTFCALGLVPMGCDQGGRDKGASPKDSADTSYDSGNNDIDSGAADGDTDTDSDLDAGLIDSGIIDEPDGSWRYEDSGFALDDGEISIEGPCADNCRYIYNLESPNWTSNGKSYFSVSEKGIDKASAYGLDKVFFFFFLSGTHNWGHVYSQEMNLDLILDRQTYDLSSGTAIVTTDYLEQKWNKHYRFSYNKLSGSFTYSIVAGGRRWQRKLPSAEAPLIMFNLHGYPAETWGTNSSLFAFLVARRFDWDSGGIQKIPVFSPEVERIEMIQVERENPDEERLTIHLPGAPFRPVKTDYLSTIEDLGRESINIVVEHGIPVNISGIHRFDWIPKSMPLFELNLPVADKTVELEAPLLPSDFSSSSLTYVSDNLTLTAAIDDPSAKGPHPVVVLLPGFEPRTRKGEIGAVDMYDQLGAGLADAGYAVVRPDARGTGGSGGDLSSATVNDLATDIKALIIALAEVAEADETNVYLVAMDTGVHVAAAAARLNDINVAGLVFMAPFAQSFKVDASNYYAYYLNNGEFVTDGAIDEDDLITIKASFQEIIDSLADGSYPGTAWRGHTPDSWKSIMDLDLLADHLGLPPILVLSGTEDHLVPPAMAAAFSSAATDSGHDISYVALEGLTHAFTRGTALGLWPEHGAFEKVDPAAIKSVTDWLDVMTGGVK